MTNDNRASKILVDSCVVLISLYHKWKKEKKHKDINDYGKIIAETIGSPVGMFDNPFGFDFFIRKQLYQIVIQPTKGDKSSIRCMLQRLDKIKNPQEKAN